MSDPAKAKATKTETVAGTLLVAFLVSLVCSSLVASAAVLLKPRQVANALLDMRRNSGGLLTEARAVADLFLPRGLVVVSTEGRERQPESLRTISEPIIHAVQFSTKPSPKP